MKIRKLNATPKLIAYLVKFAARITAFGIMIWLYIKDKTCFYEYTTAPVKDGFNFMHIMWTVFMGLMILHLFPTRILSMGARKSCDNQFVPVSGYSENELLKFVHNENIKSWRCMLCWIAGSAVIGSLFFFRIIGKPELLLLTGFFFVCDYICILIFCPFQTFGQKDRCCVNCRIYDWGHFFMFTPMLFIKSFYSWSLFFTGTAVIIRWEWLWTNHPERFWYGSNKTLSCANCHDKTCQLKIAIKESVGKTLKKHHKKHD